MSSIVFDTLLPVASALERVGAEYRIGGSVASSALGVPRATIDVDLVADLRLTQVDAFVAALGDGYYVDAEMIRDAIRARDEFNVISNDTLMKVDVFLVGRRQFDRVSFQRSVTASLADAVGARTFPFITPEDVVLHKLDWFRLGGAVSDRQWEDVLGLLAIRANTLDDAYIDHWGRELDLTDLLERARREAASRALGG